MKEEWRFYKETNSIVLGKRVYEVSNFGRVKINGNIIKDLCKHHGYYCICSKLLHKIVAELFIPNPDNKKEIDHIDTNILNNRIDNLRRCTRKENCNNPLTKKHMSKAKGGNNASWYNKHLYKETKNKISETNLGSKFMTNGIEVHYVHKDDIQKYLEMGYHFGRK